MNNTYLEILGAFAGTFSTFAYLPQVIKIIKTRAVKDISLPMYTILIIGISLWLTYGIIIKSPSMIVSNCITLTFSLIIFVLKIKWRNE